jgi:hypothetical protein
MRKHNGDMNKSGMEDERKQRQAENFGRNVDWHACQKVPKM